DWSSDVCSSDLIGENRAAAPGSEEYLYSEKYQYRHWRFDTEPNIKGLIRQVNTIRRAWPALQYNNTLRFHLTTNDELIAYSKTVPGGTDRILTVVSLNPHAPREGWVCVSLPDDVVPE